MRERERHGESKRKLLEGKREDRKNMRKAQRKRNIL